MPDNRRASGAHGENTPEIVNYVTEPDSISNENAAISSTQPEASSEMAARNPNRRRRSDISIHDMIGAWSATALLALSLWLTSVATSV